MSISSIRNRISSTFNSIRAEVEKADKAAFEQNQKEPIPPSIPTLEQFISFVKQRNLARQERFFVDLPDAPRDLTLLCEEVAIPGKNIQPRAIRINGLNEYHAHTLDYMGDSITLQFFIDTDFIARNYIENWMEMCVTPASQGREVGFYNDYAKQINLYALMPAGLPGEALINWSPTQADTGLIEALDTFNKDTPGGVRAGKALNKVMGQGKNFIDRKFARVKEQTIGRLELASNPIYEAFRESEKVIFSVSLKECWPKSINVMPLSYANPSVQRMNVTFTYKYYETHTFNDTTLGEQLANKGTKALSDLLKKEVTAKVPVGGLPQLGVDARSQLSNFTRRFGR